MVVHNCRWYVMIESTIYNQAPQYTSDKEINNTHHYTLIWTNNTLGNIYIYQAVRNTWLLKVIGLLKVCNVVPAFVPRTHNEYEQVILWKYARSIHCSNECVIHSSWNVPKGFQYCVNVWYLCYMFDTCIAVWSWTATTPDFYSPNTNKLNSPTIHHAPNWYDRNTNCMV